MDKASALETKQRRQAYAYAVATNELEGLILPPDIKAKEDALAERYAKGEITAEEFMNAPL